MAWVGKQREGLNIRVEGKYIKLVNMYVYLGGSISWNGRVDVEVRLRIQTGTNARRKVDGVMMDSTISRQLTGNVLNSCTRSAEAQR